MTAGSFLSHTSPEFLEFRRKWVERVFKPLGIVILVVYFFFVLLCSLGRFPSSPVEYPYLKQRAISSSSQWVNDLASRGDELSAWLEKHGTAGELYFFHALSASAYRSALHAYGDDGLSRFFVSSHFAFLRLIFLVIASGRMCLFLFLLATARGILSWQNHAGRDLLGETGNGRLFYSGVRVGLSDLSADGTPEKQIVGLACPKHVTVGAATASSLCKILDQYDARNATNVDLIAIILAAKNRPGFMPEFGAESLFESRMDSSLLLAETANAILQTTLDAHQLIRKGLPHQGSAPESGAEFVSLDYYLDTLGFGLHRVLTPSLLSSMREIPPTMVATLILSFLASSVLTTEQHSGQWLRKSNYPHLAARAILHSLSSFADEYTWKERTTLRRALIYASRSTIFGPVRFAVDLDKESRALRQWAELLLAPPYEVLASSDEIELFGLTVEAHDLWNQSFFSLFHGIQDNFQGRVWATTTGLLLVPAELILSLAKQVVSEAGRRRMQTLIHLVSQKQRVIALSQSQREETLQDGIPEYERIPALIQGDELKKLTNDHSLSDEQVALWSTVRTFLGMYGWLARRVGDYTVSDSGIIFAVIRAPEGTKDANSHGLIGLPGTIALRAARLSAGWGQTWSERFAVASTASMAETPEQFDRQMRGIPDEVQEELGDIPFV